MTNFVKIGKTVHAVDNVLSVSIYNNGATPAKYGLTVTTRPVASNMQSSYVTGMAIPFNYAGVLSDGLFDSYEEAETALKDILLELNN